MTLKFVSTLLQPLTGTPDLGVKMKKVPGVIKGRFYVTTPLSDSWEAFTPTHAGVTLGRFLYRLVVAFFSPTSMAYIIYGKILAYSCKIFPYRKARLLWDDITQIHTHKACIT